MLKNVFHFQGAQEYIIISAKSDMFPTPLYASNSLRYVLKFLDLNEGHRLLDDLQFSLVYYTEEFGVRIKKCDTVSQSLALNWLSKIPHLNNAYTELYKSGNPEYYRYKEDEGIQLKSGSNTPYKGISLTYPVFDGYIVDDESFVEDEVSLNNL